MNKPLSFVALLGLLNLSPAAFGQYAYIIAKEQRFDQTSNSTTTSNSSSPYRFLAQISNNPQDDSTPTPPNTFTAPGIGTPIPLSPPSASSDSQWEFKEDFASQSALDAMFANGDYVFTTAGNSGNINLSGDLYTNIPRASFNLAGTWFNGTYYIQPNQSITISTNAIAGFTAGNFRVGLEADANPNPNNYPKVQFDSLPGLTANSGNITIPGSELNPGESWSVSLQFNAFSTLNGTLIPGGTAVGIYTVKTNFTIAAVPEPGELALLTGLAGLAFATWRRRQVRP